MTAAAAMNANINQRERAWLDAGRGRARRMGRGRMISGSDAGPEAGSVACGPPLPWPGAVGPAEGLSETGAVSDWSGKLHAAHAVLPLGFGCPQSGHRRVSGMG